MRVVVIESDAYWVTEQQFNEIEAKHEEIFTNYHPDAEVDMSEYLESVKGKFQHLGPIFYDFRL